MGYNAAPLERLIEQFAKLPGIGRKGATRLAYQVLSMDKEEALDFARAIEEAHTKIHRCRVCQNFTEDEICAICTGEARDHSVARIQAGGVKEIIMATNPTVEGEATAMYVAKLVKPLGVKATRLAYGLPVGSNLEYADEVTLGRSLANRGEL